MSEKLSILEGLALKLGSLPGLGFLQNFVYNAHGAKKGITMKVGDRMNQVGHLREIGADAKKLVSRKSEKSDD